MQLFPTNHAFSVVGNADGHLDRAAAAAKPDFTHVLLCDDVEDEHSIDTIENLEMVKKVEIVKFNTSPVQQILLNLVVKIKGRKR